MQAAVSMHSQHPVTPSCNSMVRTAAGWCHLQHTVHALQCIVNGDDAAVFPVSSLVTLTFDLDIQTGPSDGPNPASV